MPSDAAALPSIAILGAGSMGGAILQGLVRSGLAAAGVTVDEPHARRRPPRWRTCDGVTSIALEERPDGNAEAAASADIVLIGVKPVMVPDLLREIAPHLAPGTIVVSLAAGVTIATFESHPRADDVAVLRSMPNTPALVGKAVTGPRRGDARVGRTTSRSSAALFETVGTVIEVPESQIDALSTISGSGPAYVFLLIEELTEGGDRQGIRRGRGAAHGGADLHRRGGAARGIRRRSRRTAPPRHEPEGHDRARDRGAAGRRTSTACSPRRRMPRSPARGSWPPAREPPQRSRAAKRSMSLFVPDTMIRSWFVTIVFASA